MKTIKLHIHGNVQGIFFRVNIKSLAIKLGIKGFVRNLEDGSIEAVIEGENDAIEEIIKYCKVGPEGAKVDKLEIKEIENKNQFQEFTILY